MKELRQKINARRKNKDSGDSELVSLIILLPLVICILLTMIDTAMYFSDRSSVAAVARDGARTVAIMGGNGTATSTTTIEKQYGFNRDALCGTLSISQSDTTKNVSTSGLSATECNILKSLSMDKGLMNVTVSKVACNPIEATGIGQRTSCSITWTYGGIPGSGLSFIGGINKNMTVGTSESEVDLTGVSLVSR